MDNLPCATKFEVETTNEVIYENGYRLGWEENKQVYVNNHLDIILRYHQPNPNVYRVVGFEVQPRSIDSSRYSFDDRHVSISDVILLPSKCLKLHSVIRKFKMQEHAFHFSGVRSTFASLILSKLAKD